MKAETRQTAIGIVAMTVVQFVAIQEGFNGAVFGTYVVGIVSLVAPEALDRLPFNGQGGS